MKNVSVFCMMLYLIVALSVVPQESRANEPEFPYAIFITKGLGTFSDVNRAVGDDGLVGGSSYPPSLTGYLPFIDNGLDTIELGTFGGADGEVQAVNNDGLVVGWATDASGDSRAFLWDEANGLQDLGSLGEDGGRAYDINELGQIVGATDMPGDDHFEAFFWENGVMINLGYLDDSKRSRAYGMNDHGVAVGESDNTAMQSRPVMWRDGKIIDLGSLGSGGNRGEANDINNLEQVVGFSYDDGERYHPFHWQNGQMYQLTSQEGYARAINDLTQVVGSVNTKAFIWEQGKGLRFLNDLKPPRNNWNIERANDISNTGYIVGHGKSDQKQFNTAFFLVPVEPEFALSDPVPGVAGRNINRTYRNRVTTSGQDLTER